MYFSSAIPHFVGPAARWLVVRTAYHLVLLVLEGYLVAFLHGPRTFEKTGFCQKGNFGKVYKVFQNYILGKSSSVQLLTKVNFSLNIFLQKMVIMIFCKKKTFFAALEKNSLLLRIVLFRPNTVPRNC